MAFRDERDALRARIVELEAIVAAGETELDSVRNERPDVGRLRGEITRLRETLSAVERARGLRGFALIASGLIVLAIGVWLGHVTAPIVRLLLAFVRADYSREAVVVRTSGAPPGGLSTGTPCAFVLDGTGSDCRAYLRCRDAVLLDDDSVDCSVRDGAIESLHDDQTVVDGDPRITMLEDDRVRVDDDGWSVELEVRGHIAD